MDMNQYIGIFIDEAREHLLKLNDSLLKLENNIGDMDIIHEIFRSAHTLKGSSATMGFENMANMTHEMENLLDLIRNNKLKLNNEIIDVIFNCLDVLEKMVDSISDSGEENIDTSEVMRKLKAATGKSPSSVTKTKVEESKEISNIKFDNYEETVLSQSIENGFNVYKVDVEIDNEAVLKSVRVFMVMNEMEKLGEIFKTIPVIEVLENEDFGNDFTFVIITNQTSDEIMDAIKSISEISNVNITELNSVVLEAEQGHEDVENDNIVNKNQAQKNSSDNSKSPSSKVISKTVRVDIDRLDELMNLFSEVIIDRGRLEELSGEIKNPVLGDIIEHMSRITTDLQNNILNLRMVQIDQVFNRFPRMVRDLSKELNKRVDLHIIGAETELDRTVIDEIGDPLVHLIRNAVDHGLESTDERLKANKPEVGSITLRAYHSGNYVFIEIADDGKGVNREVVLNKAIEKGLITSDAAQGLTDQQVCNLLFLSGFSTAKQITDVSGRGVGLDAVKSKIESLGGSITIDSTAGKGSVFTIQLPLTLSIISSMLVQINEEKYAIPLTSIIETTVYKKSEILYAQEREVIDYRGRIVPLVYLKNVFNIPSTENDEEDDEISVVIVKKRDDVAALVVNSLIGQQEIVLKSLGNYLSQKVFAILGATILGDGRVALIIDTNALIK